MGNQSPHRCFTVSMSSWQRRRRLTSLRELDGTTSVIHTCREGGVRRAAAPTLPPPPPHITCEASKAGKLAPSPGWSVPPLTTLPALGITGTPPPPPSLQGRKPRIGKAWEDGDPGSPRCSHGILLSPTEGSPPLVCVLSSFGPSELPAERPHQPYFYPEVLTSPSHLLFFHW